jgi:hypothetical protein
LLFITAVLSVPLTVYCLFVLLFITAVPSVPLTVYCLFILLFITAVPFFLPRTLEIISSTAVCKVYSLQLQPNASFLVYFGNSLFIYVYICRQFTDSIRSYSTIN